jgi:hypothetical protein
MNKFVILVLIGLVTFAVIFFAQRPDVLSEVWLWLVGLAGLIVQVVKNAVDYLRGKPDDMAEAQPTAASVREKPPAAARAVQPVPPDFEGITLSVLRYSDDGQTTVGLMYLNGQYYCYTLEDTHRDEKIAGHTRIPAGIYTLDFNRADTPLTLKYRNNFSDWFTYHIEIKAVPNFQGVYIHSGGDHTHTAGCLLVSDSLSMSAKSTFLSNSRTTYKRLYTYLSQALLNGTPVQLIIHDEAWVNALTA